MQWRHYVTVILIALISSSGASGQSARTVPDRQITSQSLLSLPLGFEMDPAPADRESKSFISRPSGFSVRLASGGVQVVLDSSKKTSDHPEVVNLRFAGSNKSAEPQANGLLPGVTNYYIGSDPAKWRTDVHQFREVRYSGVYPGIDLIFYGNRGQLEFDFDVAPWADPSQILISVGGANARKSQKGLELVTPSGKTVLLKRPDLYQIAGSEKHKIAGDYLIRKPSEVGFSVGPYDKRQALVIDPALVYSTFVGADLELTPFAIATDATGAVYVTGQQAGGNAFVLKLDPTGSSLAYRIVLGGTKTGLGPVSDQTVSAGQSITVDATGQAYIVGMTKQIDFPTTAGAFGSSSLCAPATGASCLEPFAVKLNAAGTVIYSTFLTRSSAIDSAGPAPSSIAVDSNGALYVTGTTKLQSGGTAGLLTVAGLTTTQGAFQTVRGNDSSAFVLKLHPDGTIMDYSSYLGGSTAETPGGIAVDSSGIAYIDGGTSSADFPVTLGASLATNPGTAAFFTKVKADGSGLLYSTFLAGPNGMAEGTSITIDSNQAAYLAGMTAASFPALTFGNSSIPAFASKFDAPGALVYSSLLTTQITYGHDLFFSTPPQSSISVDGVGAAYIATGSGGFFDSSISETKLDPTGTVVYTEKIGPIDPSNSRFGGVAMDNNQNFYLTGVAGSLEDPVAPIIIPDLGTTIGGLEPIPPDGSIGPQEVMFVQKFAQVLGVAVPVPNPRAISFTPILQKGATSSPRTIQLFNYGDASLSIASLSIGGINASDFAISSTNNTCGASLAVGSSCSFQVTFVPTVTTGNRTATVNLTFGGGLAAQAVTLNGSAGTPAFQASPIAVDFGSVAVGATSSISSLTITNTGTGPLDILSTPIFQGSNAADFTVCVLLNSQCAIPFTWPASIAPGGSLTVPLAVTPSALGPRSASIVFNTDAAASPQSVAVSANGSLVSIAGGTTSATVAAGQTATFSLNVTNSTLAGPITVSCSGAPAGATCNPAPSSLLPGPASQRAVVVSVTTTARTSAKLSPPHRTMWWSLVGALAMAFMGAHMRRRFRGTLIAIVAAILVPLVISCGGGSSSGSLATPTPAPTPVTTNGTPAGTYTLSVTVSTSSESHTLPLTLSVQ
jgi:hypothetical protein